ncbi:KDO2-lipid IV(A) lauroyltransferase [Lutibacter agarilyticus]|uniref:KDO2-lipid IV(A) lauroyltransferase n=1 Tax=Lutibacter agarilyticus TaxID=1109740 RepID=A0A238YQD6_9FLAO|nr:lysophospholipid acyltransferase family protein [Lutibacter agarilyticus]SNR72874.1 KDO2-lipid IV(A) lauroyltransferase [Lutibacter agarilyticus]
MNLFVYTLAYPFIWILSILPFRVLYIISDFIYLILYYVIGYRKKVVLNNLKLTFPEKSIEELLIIRKKFYKHFVDVFIEMIKTFTASKELIYKHYTFTNIDFLNDLYKDGKSIILVGPHYANWEWIMSLDSFVKYKGYAAYSKIGNKYFNNKILKSRAKFGTTMLPTSNIVSEIIYNSQNNIQAAYGLLSDQSPQLNKTHYWSTFFNVKVPIHTGAEMLVKKYNMNMVFIETKKVKRGYYETSFSLVQEKSTKNSAYGLTDNFLKKVENHVYKQPEYYLWTHKRFKHKDKVPL